MAPAHTPYPLTPLQQRQLFYQQFNHANIYVEEHMETYLKGWRRKLKVRDIVSEPVYPSYQRLALKPRTTMELLVKYGGIITGSQLLHLYGMLEREPVDVDCLMTSENYRRFRADHKKAAVRNAEYRMSRNLILELEQEPFTNTHIFIYDEDEEFDVVYSHNLRTTSTLWCIERKMEMLEYSRDFSSKHFHDLRYMLDGIKKESR